MLSAHGVNTARPLKAGLLPTALALTSTLAKEFILSEAKEHRDRAVLERGYGGAGGG
jgi:hypothetical protein